MVDLLKQVGFQCPWKLIQQLFLLIVVSLMFDFELLMDVLHYLMMSFFRYLGFAGQSVENLQLMVLVYLLLPDAVDDHPDVVYVVPEEQTREERYQDYHERLETVARMEIPKTHSQDYSCPEVIAPNVLLEPPQPVYLSGSHPVVIGGKGDGDEYAAEYVANIEVQSYDFNQVPVFIYMTYFNKSLL